MRVYIGLSIDLVFSMVLPIILFFDNKFFDLFEEEAQDTIDMFIQENDQASPEMKLDQNQDGVMTPTSRMSNKKKRKRMGSIGGKLDSLYLVKPDDLNLDVDKDQ